MSVEEAAGIRYRVGGLSVNLVTGQVEQALREACRRGYAEVVEFTVAPRDPSPVPSRGGLEWLIEFAEPPRAPDVFARVLDVTLRALNNEYGTGRARDSGILPPRILELPAGTFRRWLRASGASGVAVPRVTNDRRVADGLLAVAAAQGSGSLIAIAP